MLHSCVAKTILQHDIFVRVETVYFLIRVRVLIVTFSFHAEFLYAVPTYANKKK